MDRSNLWVLALTAVGDWTAGAAEPRTQPKSAGAAEQPVSPKAVSPAKPVAGRKTPKGF